MIEYPLVLWWAVVCLSLAFSGESDHPNLFWILIFWPITIPFLIVKKLRKGMPG